MKKRLPESESFFFVDKRCKMCQGKIVEFPEFILCFYMRGVVGIMSMVCYYIAFFYCALFLLFQPKKVSPMGDRSVLVSGSSGGRG